jgi:hypothetical protein
MTSVVPKTAVKVGVAVVMLAGLGFLFMRSVRSTRAESYVVPPEDLRNWTLALESGSGPREPMLVLRPPADLVNGLFKQVFKRAMESMNPPSAPGIPLLLQGEYDRAFGGRVTPEALLATARAAGLDRSALVPRCLAHRRISDPGGPNQQLYFVVFDMPAYARFRQQVAALAGGGAPRADFEPDALSPVLFVAAAESTFERWLPLRAEPQADCVAPIEARSTP